MEVFVVTYSTDQYKLGFPILLYSFFILHKCIKTLLNQYIIKLPILISTNICDITWSIDSWPFFSSCSLLDYPKWLRLICFPQNILSILKIL